MKRSSLFSYMLLLVICSGCNVVTNSMRDSHKISGWNPIKAPHSGQSTDEAPEPARSMAAIWNFGVYEKPGSPSIRGLGGRIYFYDADSNAVPAHGELIVYGFDEDSGSKTQPDKKFVFRDSEFQSHFSESPLGGSYSVWVPWDKVGGYRKSVILIPVFKTADGRVLRSGQSINLLAGSRRKNNSQNPQEPFKVLGASNAVLGGGDNTVNLRSAQTQLANGVAQASFAEADSSSDDNPFGEFHQRIRTTEIPLTANLQRQIDISNRVGAGERVFQEDLPGRAAASSVTAATFGQAESTNATPIGPSSDQAVGSPAARTSTKSGVFGAPGAIR